MRPPVAASRLPVGSSANRIRGSLAKARAMATRAAHVLHLRDGEAVEPQAAGAAGAAGAAAS